MHGPEVMKMSAPLSSENCSDVIFIWGKSGEVEKATLKALKTKGKMVEAAGVEPASETESRQHLRV